MKRIFRFLKSLKLSLALLIILLPLIALGNLIPQTGRLSPTAVMQWQTENPRFAEIVSATGLDHLYTSWWFLVLFTILFLNMTLVTWGLIKKTRVRAKGLHRFTGEAPDYFELASFPYAGEILDTFERAMRQQGYNIIKVGGEIYARKSWLGIWGGTILHIGLVVILSGAVLSGLFRFSGYTEIGEGQGFIDQTASYLQTDYGPLFLGHHDDFQIFLNKTEKIDTDMMQVIRSKVTIREGNKDSTTKTIKVNEPLRYKGMKVYQSKFTGPAVLFAISDNPLSDSGLTRGFTPRLGFVNLQYGKDEIASTVFSVPDTLLQTKIVLQKGENRIGLEVRMNDALVYRGPMAIGQRLNLEEWSLQLVAFARWSGLRVVYDWAVPVIFFGFWLSIFGIAVMALFDPREIWIRVIEDNGGRKIKIVGWGRWKNMFKEEVDGIFGDISSWKR